MPIFFIFLLCFWFKALKGYEIFSIKNAPPCVCFRKLADEYGSKKKERVDFFLDAEFLL